MWEGEGVPQYIFMESETFIGGDEYLKNRSSITMNMLPPLPAPQLPVPCVQAVSVPTVPVSVSTSGQAPTGQQPQLSAGDIYSFIALLGLRI